MLRDLQSLRYPNLISEKYMNEKPVRVRCGVEINTFDSIDEAATFIGTTSEALEDFISFPNNACILFQKKYSISVKGIESCGKGTASSILLLTNDRPALSVYLKYVDSICEFLDIHKDTWRTSLADTGWNVSIVVPETTNV